MAIAQLDFGSRHPENKDCVFVWIYCKDAQPYKKYSEVEDPNQVIPMVFALLRWDGSFGTIGGKVDQNESLYQAVCREAFEEVGYILPSEEYLEPMMTLVDKDGYHIHSYSLEMTYQELQSLRRRAENGCHFTAECAGANLVHATHYKGNAGITTFLNNEFCGTSKEELQVLFEHINKL